MRVSHFIFLHTGDPWPTIKAVLNGTDGLKQEINTIQFLSAHSDKN